MEDGDGLRWLVLDMNSFFASCEQQANPRLRGRPVAIVPADTDTTCAIAASMEAKRFGIKTGTMVREAKLLCPELVLVRARPRLYVAAHHRFIEAIEACIPIEDVMSVDEVACRLDRTQQTASAVRRLSAQIKTVMREMAGECLTCSIGAASNRLLAKLASDMQKPDGLTILRPADMPQAIMHLAPGDICGIGASMQARLAYAGITSMRALWEADAGLLRRVWGGVMGARFHALLHGMDLPAPVRPRRSMGHQHVLEPETRTMPLALSVVRRLLAKAATRLRQEEFYARRLILDIKWTGRLGHFVDEVRFKETQDTRFFLRCLGDLWARAPERRPLRVGVTLADLVPVGAHQFDLFDRPRNGELIKAVDCLNEKFGRGTVSFGNSASYIPSKIPFSHVPDIGET
ncbi:MAG: DNA polymerase [Bdellovibrionales bacterium]